MQRTTIDIPDWLHKWLKENAEKSGVSIKQLMTAILVDYKEKNASAKIKVYIQEEGSL